MAVAVAPYASFWKAGYARCEDLVCALVVGGSRKEAHADGQGDEDGHDDNGQLASPLRMHIARTISRQWG